MVGWKPGRAATVKPLIVCGVVKLSNIDCTIAGACSGVGAIASIRCLKVQTPRWGLAGSPPKPARTGSSTTLRSRIISSLRVLTRQPVAETT